MKIVEILAPLASLFAFAAVVACTAPTPGTAPKDVYYATPAVAASLSPDGVTEREGATAPGMTKEMQPFVRGESGFTPASSEDLENLRSEALPGGCHVCVLSTCYPICCPGTPHCQPYNL